MGPRRTFKITLADGLGLVADEAQAIRIAEQLLAAGIVPRTQYQRGVIPADLRQFIEDHASQRSCVIELTEKVLPLADITPVNGKGDYYKIYHRASSHRAVAWYDIRLGTLTLELPPGAADGRVHARRRKITSNDRCHVAIKPTSEGAVTEAVELIKEALLYREAQ